MSSPLIPLFAKEHPGETFDGDDVNEWAYEEIARLRSNLVDINAIVGSAYTDEMLKDSQAKVEQLKLVIERYKSCFRGDPLPENIDIDTAIKARDAALSKLQALQAMFSTFCGNVREELL